MKNKKIYNENFYLISYDALPNIYKKVLEAKELIESKDYSISEATKNVHISRTTYYKYSNHIFKFNNSIQEKKVTISVQIFDVVGILSELCKILSNNNCNILTIHQAIPVNKITNIIISLDISNTNQDFSSIISEIKNLDNVKYVKVLALE